MWSLVLLCHFFYFSTIPSDTDAEKPGPAKRRRKSTSAGGIPLSRVGSPGSLLKPALTERQQMALLMQMTDPQKQEQQTPPGRGGGALYAGRGGAALYAGRGGGALNAGRGVDVIFVNLAVREQCSPLYK